MFTHCLNWLPKPIVNNEINTKALLHWPMPFLTFHVVKLIHLLKQGGTSVVSFPSEGIIDFKRSRLLKDQDLFTNCCHILLLFTPA